MNKGSKYYPLFEHLRRSRQDEINLTFAEIEAIIDGDLPPSAQATRAWWSNRSGKGALQASAWMEAKYCVTKLDLDSERVTFSKITPEHYDVQHVGDTVLWNGGLVKALRLHMGFSQTQLAEELGVRQQTISEWETGVYKPSRAMSKYLGLIAERAGFSYLEEG